MRFSVIWVLACTLACALVGCASDSGAGGSGGSGGSVGAPGEGGAGGGAVPAPAIGCDPLVPTYCGFPYPNDYFTVSDESTVTGRPRHDPLRHGDRQAYLHRLR